MCLVQNINTVWKTNIKLPEIRLGILKMLPLIKQVEMKVTS